MGSAHSILKNNIIISILCFILGLTLGGVFSFSNLKHSALNGDFLLDNGIWKVNPTMDLKDPHQRAIVSLVGLFALRESEVLYYSASQDNEGRPLSSRYNYLLDGSVPEARYWSYTLYGDDDFLIPNESKIYGYNASSMSFEPIDTLNPELGKVAMPTYQIHISATDQGDKNWLPSGDNDEMTVLLRMYNPAPHVYQNLASIPLPTIRRVE